MNALIAAKCTVQNDNFLYCNPDQTRTQAFALDLTPELLLECRKSRYLFIRKVSMVNAVSASLLRDIYNQPDLFSQWS